MKRNPHPYVSQPERAFWRSAIGNRHFLDVADLWRPMPLRRSDRIATAGSCFAQHIGNSLQARGATFMDMEPMPPLFATREDARRWGYGVYSCRYGNIYTSRQLLQLFDEAHGNRTPMDRVWEKASRFYDAQRPSVDPVGHDSPETVMRLRRIHLSAVRRMFAELDVFVFTMGLTEGWEDRRDGTMYAVAPGTIAGSYDPEIHAFHNLRFQEIRDDMLGFWSRLREVNPQARMLLTVSPVPLAATATEDHVLVATIHSKSILRAVAGELVGELDGVFYFPSYEIISSHPSRGMFFDPDLRNVNMYGVNHVMSHFFTGDLEREFVTFEGLAVAQDDLICDESRLDRGEEAV